MSKRTIIEAPGVELIARDLYSGKIPDEQLELEIGGWQYDLQQGDRLGAEKMIEVIDELHASLDVARAELFRIWQEGMP